MALWNETKTPAAGSPNVSGTPASSPAPAPARDGDAPARAAAAHSPVAVADTPRGRTAPATEPKESIIAAGLSIEGKIEGTGHVRISGRFKGDVHVEGDVTIESGAHLAGQVRAGVVIVAGELHGNVDAARRVELVQSGAITGDVKAGSLTVAAGARMKGAVEFGWDEKESGRLGEVKGIGSRNA